MQSALLFRPRAVRPASRRSSGSDAGPTNQNAANADATVPKEQEGAASEVGRRDAAEEPQLGKRQLSDGEAEQSAQKKPLTSQNSLQRELELKEALLRKFLEEQRRLRERCDGAGEPPQQEVEEGQDGAAAAIHEAALRDAEAGNEDDLEAKQTEAEIQSRTHGIQQEARSVQHVAAVAAAADVANAEVHADEEGYYTLRENDVILQRYQVHSLLGKGVYSSVFKATDMLTNQAVAVKVMRSNQMMSAAGAKEASILDLLEREAVAQNSSSTKMNIVPLLHSFTFRGHYCMVLELAHCSLRRVIRKYKNGSGLSLSAVRTFGRQLFRALRHIHSVGIVHADLKPDNIVLNRKLNVAKICDFGSAYRADELSSLSSTQYIVARYYRAPEIVLGYAAKSAAMDIWSIGVTLVEMYTSKLLFTGRHNNALLKSIMDLLGPVPKALIRRSEHRSKYFRHDFKFLLLEKNRGSGTESTRPINPTRQMDLGTFLSVERSDSGDENTEDVQEFEDLVRQCLQYDPAERITAEEALKHPFFKRPHTQQQHR